MPSPPRVTRSQMAIVAVVGVAVVALFTYMFVNSGPDEARQRELAAADAKAEAAAPSTLVPAISTTTTPEAVTPTTIGPESTVFVDEDRFCLGARYMVGFELRVVAGLVERDWSATRQAAIVGRPAWDRSVEDMLAGAALRLRPDIEFYRDQYIPFLDRLATSTSAQDVGAAALQVDRPRLAGSISRITRKVVTVCS